MSVRIVPLNEQYFQGLHQAFDGIAREKRYFPIFAAPSLAESIEWYRSILYSNHLHFLAIRNDCVLGWCDIMLKKFDACQHVGTLGIGVISAARHQGIGRLLMSHAIDRAWQSGLSRIELTVRTDNRNARALYEKMGFVSEGIQRQAFKVDNDYFDIEAMALLR